MPIFFQQDIDRSTRLGVWKIEEGELFFLRSVPLQHDISHPHKRLQHLAGRYLLRYLFPAFPVDLIRIADTRKPFLEDEAFHFSISHCGDFAAVVVSRENRVGVDIEQVSAKTERVRHKFMTAAEARVLSFLPGSASATLLWSVKEAVFKWDGSGGVDFRGHISLEEIEEAGENLFQSHVRFRKTHGRSLDLYSRFFQGLCLSYVCTGVG